MKSNAPWSVKGIERDARETAKAAAQREGLTVGEWLNQTIYTAGDPDAAPTIGDIEGLKPRDLAAAIEHLSRRIAASESKSADAVETLARSLGGAVERLQRLERSEPAGGGASDGLAARVEALESKATDRQRIEALRALERAVGQIAVQFDTTQKAASSRLEAAERQLQAIAGRIETAGGDQISAGAVRDAIEGMAERVARAEKIAAEAARLKTEAGETADADFVHKTGIRLRILGDEIKRGGDQIRTLETTITRLSQQIDAAEKRSAEGVQKVAETIAELRSQFASADASDQAASRAEIEAAVSEITQRTEDRIETLQQSFDAMVRRLEGAAAVREPAREIGSVPLAAAPAARIASEPLDEIDSELEDAFAALELEEPIPTPAVGAAKSAPDDEDDDFGFDLDEPKSANADRPADPETEDVLAEIREAFGLDDTAKAAEPAERAEDTLHAQPAPADRPVLSPEPPPIAEDAAEAEAPPPQGDYLKAARQAAREAAAKAASEAEAGSGKRKLTPKQRAILAARIKKRKEDEANAKARALAAAPDPAFDDDVAETPPKDAASVKARVKALVDKIKARPARREEPAFNKAFDKAADDTAPSNADPSIMGGANSAIAKFKKIPNAGGVLGLGGAIVLLVAASFLLFKDFGRGKPPKRAEPAPAPIAESAPAPASAAATTPVPSAPAADSTVRPRDLYLNNIAALKSATTDADARAALKPIEEAAALGHPPAQLQIGELYKLGQLYDRDLAVARQWFERAANGGNVLAMHRLGVMAARGEGGPVDPALSVKWFERAAGFGLVDSQYNLGATYHPTADGAATGIQDRGKAYFWYSIAAKNGDAQAGEMAAGLASSMPAAEKSAKDAEVAAFAPKTPDPLANELAPAS